MLKSAAEKGIFLDRVRMLPTSMNPGKVELDKQVQLPCASWLDYFFCLHMLVMLQVLTGTAMVSTLLQKLSKSTKSTVAMEESW
jgi:hypothetical protein